MVGYRDSCFDWYRFDLEEDKGIPTFVGIKCDERINVKIVEVAALLSGGRK